MPLQATEKELIMDIPMNVNVYCSDGLGGRSSYVILNPTTDQITHFVVEEKEFPQAQRLVPISLIQSTTPEEITLHCTKDELSKQESFLESTFLPANIEADRTILMWPYTLPETPFMVWTHRKIPAGELAIRRGTHVFARDGAIGKVDEFLVDPKDGSITHLILREGHLWGQKDVTIPVSEIDRIREYKVFLKLDKRSIEALPTIPVQRKKVPQP